MVAVPSGFLLRAGRLSVCVCVCDIRAKTRQIRRKRFHSFGVHVRECDAASYFTQRIHRFGVQVQECDVASCFTQRTHRFGELTTMPSASSSPSTSSSSLFPLYSSLFLSPSFSLSLSRWSCGGGRRRRRVAVVIAVVIVIVVVVVMLPARTTSARSCSSTCSTLYSTARLARLTTLQSLPGRRMSTCLGTRIDRTPLDIQGMRRCVALWVGLCAGVLTWVKVAASVGTSVTCAWQDRLPHSPIQLLWQLQRLWSLQSLGPHRSRKSMNAGRPTQLTQHLGTSLNALDSNRHVTTSGCV